MQHWNWWKRLIFFSFSLFAKSHIFAIHKLSRKLPKSSISESLSSIVICLFPLVEQTIEADIYPGDRLLHNDLCDWSDIHPFDRKFPHFIEHPICQNSIQEGGRTFYSKSIRMIANAYYSEQLSKLSDREARSRAIAIIIFLFQDRLTLNRYILTV